MHKSESLPFSGVVHFAEISFKYYGPKNVLDL